MNSPQLCDSRDRTALALAEAVAHGLDQGWVQVHKGARQPSKAQLLDALYEGVMRQIAVLLERKTS